jgi:HSP20 family protein
MSLQYLQKLDCSIPFAQIQPMFKFFGLGNEETHSDDHSDWHIHVEHSDEEAPELDVGQVALDILDGEEAITIIAPLAGIDISEIDISVTRNILTISGERVRPSVYSESNRMLVTECFFGPFSRSIILPENLAFNKVQATMENNLLSVSVPKLSFPSKTIKINKLES